MNWTLGAGTSSGGNVVSIRYLCLNLDDVFFLRDYVQLLDRYLPDAPPLKLRVYLFVTGALLHRRVDSDAHLTGRLFNEHSL